MKMTEKWKMPGDEGYFAPAVPGEPPCFAESSNRLLCTRARGHEGNHAAHGYPNAQLYDWPNDAQEDAKEDGKGPLLTATTRNYDEYEMGESKQLAKRTQKRLKAV